MSVSHPQTPEPASEPHPVSFSVDYPDRELDRLATAFRIFTVIPIAIVLASIGGYSSGSDLDGGTIVIGGTGLLFLPPLLMVVFRQKYPRWWFDWNWSCSASRTGSAPTSR